MDFKNISNETLFVAAAFVSIAATITLFNATKNKNNTLALAAGFAAGTSGYLAYKKSKQIKSN